MQINKMISSYNYNVGYPNRIKFIVIHYVGALGGAKENCQYYAAENRNASAHYFVGHSGEVWQSVEDKNIAWHVGANNYVHPNCRNANSIAVEMCVKKKNKTSLAATDKDWYFEKVTVEATIELVKSLMKQYNVSLQNVVRHYDVTGKICPNPYVYNSMGCVWEEFKGELAIGEENKLLNKKGDFSEMNKEQIQKIIGDMYYTILGRSADIKGLEYHTRKVLEGVSFIDVYQSFVNSEEGIQFYVTNILYRKLLKREPDKNGFNYFIKSLKSGNHTRETAYAEVIDSVEYKKV
jgi:Negative regulator of beta-lactamase expression